MASNTRSSARRGTQESGSGSGDGPPTGSSDSTVNPTDPQQQRIQALEQQVRELQATVAEQSIEEIPREPDSGPHQGRTQPREETSRDSSFRGLSEALVPTPKTIRPEKIRPYRGESEGEHIRWFADAEIKFLLSHEYFTTDRNKILYCVQSLEGDAMVQWRNRFRPENVDNYTFESFKTFLLDLVADPMNRRLLAHERWNNAKQGKEQKVSVFKAYLEELEAHLEILPEVFRASIFLSKLRPEIKDKILSTGNVPTTREDILALAIMQERTLERFHAASTKPNHKGRPLEERVSRNPHSGGSEPPAKRFKKDKDKDKDQQKSKSNTNIPAKPEHKSDACFICGGKGHWKKDCPQKDNPNFTPVNSVQSKNDKAPSSDQRRGKKEKDK